MKTRNHASRLRNWAENILTYETDLSRWGKRQFVVEEMRKIADDFETLETQLDDLLNNPEVLSFIEGVKREVAHQKERWGEVTDREKSAENWYWLVGYLAGKALRAHIEEDIEKALHHTISAAAALANWHEFIKNGTSKRGLTKDPDLRKIQKEIVGE
jgi:hypothetical protein